MKQNPYFQNVGARYLFQDIADRVKTFKEKNPHAHVISLGIGDTTQPIHPVITQAIETAAKDQAKAESYIGYGPEQGLFALRKQISDVVYQGSLVPDEIFISDGTKCDLGRLQILFGPSVKIALQDPTYPVYLDTAKLSRDMPITMLSCTPENNFMPDLAMAKDVDVLFLCAPNNPTGTTFSRDELSHIVDFAKKNSITIIYDAAYSFFVQEGPKSIYEIPGAKDVSIELGSFSKLAGFSGIRLGWTVVPKTLLYTNGKSVHADWNRISTTFFNGASILSQKGGLVALSDEAMVEIKKQTMYYLQNIQLLKKTFLDLGAEVYGGEHIPYAWMKIPGYSSWQLFDMFLHQTHCVTTPGVGFGPSGEGFIRISGFAKQEQVQEAVLRIQKQFMSRV